MKISPKILIAAAAVSAVTASGQQLKSGYIDAGVSGPGFGQAVQNWSVGQKWTDDDNFYISRVRPHKVFRNQATQVDTTLNEENDKKLLMWTPINSPGKNALPDGVFDSEVFPMWNYVTHFGNWTASLVRIPASFTDAAHKNGVAVSCVAGIPYGEINDTWLKGLQNLIKAGSTKVADYMEYYGVDGLGYNSEFQYPGTLVESLSDFHGEIVSQLKQNDRMPLVENVWYDGTQNNGYIAFDRGLTNNNAPIWGEKGNEKAVLFFNYNWNRAALLSASVNKAKELGRSPLDLYCGFNMQGPEPKSGQRWPLLANYPLSIGLWGAHSENMFWETRNEQGNSPEARQKAYMERVERWFSSGSRNPLNDLEITNDMNYGAKNYQFFGMSKLMSARSPLSWDLSQEPFITYFNLGNGKFFNYQGQRQHNSEWYNLAVQDYLPTWRFWFANKFLGRDIEDLPETGMDAIFDWDDAYFGGSTLHLTGSTSEPEYLHLFKTQYKLQAGDVITVRFKLVQGEADVNLALSAEGDEENNFSKPVISNPLKGVWVEKKFTVGNDFSSLSGKTLAMVALEINSATNADICLGEFSIIRPGATAQIPQTPVIETAKLLSSSSQGIDGKIIFNMPNNKAPKVCYNLDVNTSMFLLYAQQEGGTPVMMGATTSWAGMIYSFPAKLAANSGKVRLGVQAVGLDMEQKSPIAWSEYMETPAYAASDAIELSREIIHPFDAFSIKFSDPLHAKAKWEIRDMYNKITVTEPSATEIKLPEGLPYPGRYDVTVTIGDSAIVYPSYFELTPRTTGNAPYITAFGPDGYDGQWHADKTVMAQVGQPVVLSYKGVPADGQTSQGLKLGSKEVGFKWSDVGINMRKSFSLTFWLKSDGWDKGNSLLNIRDQTEGWPRNQWGWLWHTIDGQGKVGTFAIRGQGGDLSYQFANTVISPNVWHHMAYVFEFDNYKVIPHLYVDGQKQEVTSWFDGKNNRQGPPEMAGPTGSQRTKYAVSLAGNIHTTAPIQGSIDQLELHNRALTPQEVIADMNGKPKQQPYCTWSFDTTPGEDGSFKSTGSKEIPGGQFVFPSTGNVQFVEPILASGCPYMAETPHQVTTEAKWTAVDGDIKEAYGNDKAGEAKIQWNKPGVYMATLKLENGYGSDSRTVKVNVGETSIPESMMSDSQIQVYPTAFTSELTVEVPEAGVYEIAILDMQGKAVFRQKACFKEAGSLTLSPNIQSGLYILTATSSTIVSKAVKVIKR